MAIELGDSAVLLFDFFVQGGNLLIQVVCQIVARGVVFVFLADEKSRQEDGCERYGSDDEVNDHRIRVLYCQV